MQTCSETININDQLLVAARKNEVSNVERLLEAKANLSAIDGEGRSAIEWLVKHNCLELVAKRIQEEHVTQVKKTDGSTLLHHAVSEEMLVLLITARADINAARPAGDAARLGDSMRAVTGRTSAGSTSSSSSSAAMADSTLESDVPSLRGKK